MREKNELNSPLNSSSLVRYCGDMTGEQESSLFLSCSHLFLRVSDGVKKFDWHFFAPISSPDKQTKKQTKNINQLLCIF
jgi:hypothetical protein